MREDQGGGDGRRGGVPPLMGQGESETLLARVDTPAQANTEARQARGGATPAPSAGPEHRPLARRVVERIIDGRSHPFLRVIAYYILIVALMSLAVYYVPTVRRAFLSPVALPMNPDGALTAGPVGDFGSKLTLEEALQRAISTLLVIVGALTLVVPVAWVYMLTKRFRFDPALVASVIILPIVVAGIALVVKNSIALAFALAGIVGAVRFRNTLKDPRDAVYIFLVIVIGLSAGVQALDVAVVISFAFNIVVLIVWKFNVGSIYSGRYARTGILSVGAQRLLMAQEPAAQREVRRRMLDQATDIKTDGILLVHSHQPDLARLTVQEALADTAKAWQLVDVVRREDGLRTLEYLVRLKRTSTAPELVGALDERWSEQVAAAEYVPFRARSRKRKKP